MHETAAGDRLRVRRYTATAQGTGDAWATANGLLQTSPCSANTHLESFDEYLGPKSSKSDSLPSIDVIIVEKAHMSRYALEVHSQRALETLFLIQEQKFKP